MKPATTLKPPKSTSRKPVDPDNPPWAEDMLGPPVMQRGQTPQGAQTTVSTTIQIDADILAWFKAQGAGYEVLINSALRHVMEERLTKKST